jgi:hypothetical protein
MNALAYEFLTLVGVTECSMCSHRITAPDFTDRLRDQITQHAPFASQLSRDVHDIALMGQRGYLNSGCDPMNSPGEALMALAQTLPPAILIGLRDWTNSIRERSGPGAMIPAVAMANRLDAVLNSMALADAGGSRSAAPSAVAETGSLAEEDLDEPISPEFAAALGLVEVDDDDDDDDRDPIEGDSRIKLSPDPESSGSSAEGPLSLPEDGTPRYVIQSAVQEETFEQMCLRLRREGSPELAQDDSVDLDPPTGAAHAGSSASTEPDLPPVGLEPSRAPEAVGFAPGQDDSTLLKASAEVLAAIDQSIRETLERELGEVDVAPDAIDLGEPLAELDLVDELELELDDATDDGLLGGGTGSPASP